MTKEELYWERRKVKNNILHKRCTVCSEWKPETIDNFYMKNKKHPEWGLCAECKECSKTKSRQYQNKNAETAIPKIRAHQLKNRKEYLAYKREYEKQNKEINRLKVRKWREENPDKCSEYGKRRRMHKMHDITEKQWIACKDYFKNDNGEWSCAYCSLPISQHTARRKEKVINMDFHKEHIDDDGSNGLDNCIPACTSCNCSKGQFDLDEWYNPNGDRIGAEVYSEERYNKIIKWMTKDYKKYI